MINEIAVCLSYISNDYLLMLVAVLFYIFSKRSEHAHLVILLLFAMVYKAILKELLKIPAPVTSPTKYGFPSGHINFAVVFFGWFMVTYQTKLLYWLCPIALVMASISTIYLGYHDIYDVLLTPILPVCYLTIYLMFMKHLALHNFVIVFVIVCVLLQLLSKHFLGRMPIDVIIGSYGILGFGISSLVLSHRVRIFMLFLIALLIFFALSDDMIQFSKNCVWLIAFGSLPLISKMIGAVRGKFSL